MCCVLPVQVGPVHKGHRGQRKWFSSQRLDIMGRFKFDEVKGVLCREVGCPFPLSGVPLVGGGEGQGLG